MAESRTEGKSSRPEEPPAHAAAREWMKGISALLDADWSRTGVLEVLSRLQVLAGDSVSLGARLPELGVIAMGPDAETLQALLESLSETGAIAARSAETSGAPGFVVRAVPRGRDGSGPPVKVGILDLGGLCPSADGSSPCWLGFSVAGATPIRRLQTDLWQAAIVLAARIRLEERRARALLLERFLATVAHELKGPLTALLGTLELELRLRSRGSSIEGAGGPGTAPAPVIEGAPATLPASPVLQRMLRELWRMNEMVQALMETALLRSGRFSVDRRPVRFKDWMDRLMEDRLQPLSAEFGVALDCRQAGMPEFVWMDPLRMEELVTNLATFSLRASPEGESVRLSWSIEPEGGEVVLCVDDRGPAFSPEERARLFVPFEAPTQVLKRGALGLALYLAREIALAHQGTLVAEGLDSSRGGRTGDGNRLRLAIPSVQPTGPAGNA